MPTKTRKRTSKAPASVRLLLQSLDDTFGGKEIDQAFAAARAVLSADDTERAETINRWVQDTAEAQMEGGDNLPANDSPYSMYDSGCIQAAFADHSVMLGFCLAWLVLRPDVQRDDREGA